jgi:hypothetical protein
VDLNQLYFAHQIALMKASQALGHGAHCEHAASASQIAGRIVSIQRELRAGAASGWDFLAQAAPAPLQSRWS